jgi:DNA-binding NarL/FixJ family response regulator
VNSNVLVAPKIVLGRLGTMNEGLEAEFRQHGWRVGTAAEADGLRTMAHRCKAAVVLLPVAPLAESGFLTCAKLVLSMPKSRIYLIGPDEEELERFALFAGAAGYFAEGTSPADIASAILAKVK